MKRPTKQKPDPIFALIEKHKQAAAEDIAAAKAFSTMRRSDETYPAADARTQKAWKNLRAAQLKLLKATPTTTSGCIALMRHVMDPQGKEAFGGGFDNTPLGDLIAEYANCAGDSCDHLIKVAHAFLPRIADRIEKLSA